MKLTFWLLDINYEVKNHKPEVWLWGIDQDGNRILVIDREFEPYFYAVLKENVDAKSVMEGIKARKNELPFITRMETVDKKYFGKKVKALKIFCQDPNLIEKYAKRIGKIEGVKECLEDDIRYSMRYIIDNEVTPCGWHQLEVEEIPNNLKVRAEKIFLAKSKPVYTEKHEIPKLRILGFSIICYSAKGSPKPDKNPVIIISTATNTGEKKQFTAENSENDEGIIREFINYVNDFDPDIIVGYGSNRFDLPYLAARARKHGFLLSIDRAGTEPHRSVYGHMSITGRANVDLFDFADEFPEVKVKTLENIADYLGVMKLEERTIIEDVDYPEYWETPEKKPQLLEFSMENTRCIMGIAEAILDFAIQLSNLVCLPLDHVGAAAVGFRVEWFLIRHAYHLNELVPKRIERPYRPYAGAIVLAPKPGLHENVCVLDFKAMYPNIMITYNVSPDTYVPPEQPEPPCGVYVAPEVKHRFRKEPSGFYREVLSRLIATRDEIKAKLKSFKPESPHYRLLDARQKAVKVITNATYGYAGWIGARWYIKPVAEAATAWGRYTISNTIKLAEKAGLEVVYGDTDSIFIKYEPEKIDAFIKQIEKELGLEIKPDKIYTRILFTEAKKRYCGLLPDGRLDIVGLEVIRGDWAEVAKGVQEKVLEIVLKERSPQKAADYVRQFISDMQARKIPLRKFVIWKTLTKKLEDYEVRAPHVEAARMLKKEGWDLTLGDKIGYVIVSGTGRLYERVKPYMFASIEELDIEYYVKNQVVPVAARILSIFGIKKDELLAKKGVPKTLTDFFKS